MITGELRSQVAAIWDAFWSGGLSNPLVVLEQLTYLLFLRHLDELSAQQPERGPRRPAARSPRSAPSDQNPGGRLPAELRWSQLKGLAPGDLFARFQDQVFPFLRTLDHDGTAYARHMRDARFAIPTPVLLARVVALVDRLPLDDRDTMGDLYEYLLSKLAGAGQNGQFRTPRHLIQLLVELTAPTAQDRLCDPAAGTCGFLVAAAQYLRKHDQESEQRHRDADTSAPGHRGSFHGFEVDPVMLRIGSMNLLLHGIADPDLVYRDALSAEHAQDRGRYTLILANPPFAGAVDAAGCAADLQPGTRTRKTELLFLSLVLRLLAPGGRAAVIVPEGVLFGASAAHKALRRSLIEEQKLEAVLSLPAGAFKPYAGVSTAALLFTRTDCGGTDHVWFYDVTADGLSLDDRRQPLLPADKLGPVPPCALTAAEHAHNNLPDVLARWPQRNTAERLRPRTAQSFCVPRDELAASGYDLSLRRYHEAAPPLSQHRSPQEILASLARIEEELRQGMKKLQELLL